MNDFSEHLNIWHALAARQADWQSSAELHLLHQADLARVRRIVNAVFDRLEEDMRSPASPEEGARAFWWGARDSVITILPKLAQIILKIVPLERKIAAEEGGKEDTQDAEKLTEEDIRIIQRFTDELTTKQPTD